MREHIAIENIEELRRLAGVEDTELSEQICGLRTGDLVRLTLLTDGAAFETLTVRITSIRGTSFRGKLVSRPTLAGLSKLGAGFPLAFGSTHIHSILKREPSHKAGSHGRSVVPKPVSPRAPLRVGR